MKLSAVGKLFFGYCAYKGARAAIDVKHEQDARRAANRAFVEQYVREQVRQGRDINTITMQEIKNEHELQSLFQNL